MPTFDEQYDNGAGRKSTIHWQYGTDVPPYITATPEPLIPRITHCENAEQLLDEIAHMLREGNNVYYSEHIVDEIMNLVRATGRDVD